MIEHRVAKIQPVCPGGHKTVSCQENGDLLIEIKGLFGLSPDHIQVIGIFSPFRENADFPHAIRCGGFQNGLSWGANKKFR